LAQVRPSAQAAHGSSRVTPQVEKSRSKRPLPDLLTPHRRRSVNPKMPLCSNSPPASQSPRYLLPSVRLSHWLHRPFPAKTVDRAGLSPTPPTLAWRLCNATLYTVIEKIIPYTFTM
jgi:hypothetical protein